MNLKQQAAAKAMSLVPGNHIVGLEAGSTIACAIEILKSE